MQQFDLDTWLKNKSRKIITRTDKPVRIVCWDSPNKAFPIMGFIDNEPEIFVWDCFGYCCEGHIETEFDLFFADEEEKLTEFEKAMIQFSHERNSLIQFEHTKDEINAHLYRYSKKLLDLARKELEANYYTKVLDDRVVFKSDLHDRDMQGAYELGKQDALKDLPKWKQMPNGIQGNGDFKPTYLVKSYGNYLITPCLSWNEDSMYIELSELEKLPKE